MKRIEDMYKDGEDVIIEGVEYACHYSEDKKRLFVNNFLVANELIIEELQKDNKFIPVNRYRKLWTDFCNSMRDIDVDVVILTEDEYDYLVQYELPIANCLNLEFLKTFSKTINNYEENFDEELNYIFKVKK